MSDVSLLGSYGGAVDSASLPEATSSAIGAVKKNKWQFKENTSNLDLSDEASGDVTPILSFSNLEIGKTYRLSFKFESYISSSTSGSFNGDIQLVNSPNVPYQEIFSVGFDTATANKGNTYYSDVVYFEAQGTSLLLRYIYSSKTGNADVRIREARATLEELNNVEITTDFT